MSHWNPSPLRLYVILLLSLCEPWNRIFISLTKYEISSIHAYLKIKSIHLRIGRIFQFGYTDLDGVSITGFWHDKMYWSDGVSSQSFVQMNLTKNHCHEIHLDAVDKNCSRPLVKEIIHWRCTIPYGWIERPCPRRVETVAWSYPHIFRERDRFWDSHDTS